MIRSTLIFAALAMVPLVAGTDSTNALPIFVGSMACNGIWHFVRVALSAPERVDQNPAAPEVNDAPIEIDSAVQCSAMTDDAESAAEFGGETVTAHIECF